MPTSRNRRRRRTPPDRRRARRRGDRRELVATLRPGEDITPLLTPEDVAHFAAAADAAARGDVRGAIEHELAGLIVEESLTVPRLQDLHASDPAPTWAYSRWCVDQAMRWMLLHEDPRVEQSVWLTLAAAHADRLESLADRPLALTEYGTLIAACDWICAQLAVFEYGGLADFLDVRAEPGLVAKADRIRDWALAPMGVYTYVGIDGPGLVLRDLVHEEEVPVLNIGAMADRDHGDGLLGRVVPISASPGLMFESRPLAVDDQTARDAAARIRVGEPRGWLDAVAIARDERRLMLGFSYTEQTLFTSDLTVARRDQEEPAPAPRVQALMDRGYSASVANAIGVIEVALIVARDSPDALGAAVPHVTAALVVPGAFDVALEECTSRSAEAAWTALADMTPDHVSERCCELAARARAA